MKNEQAKKMLKAKLECLKRETSGTDFDCNRCNCDECPLNYEQGNIGEQKEALTLAIQALEQKPKTGKWIPIHPLQADDDGAYMCSCCRVGNWGIDPKVDKYCFNCGARMNGGGEDAK